MPDVLFASGRGHGVRPFGPMLRDQQWQAKADKGFTVQHSGLDWERAIATRPVGRTSAIWTPDLNQGGRW